MVASIMQFPPGGGGGGPKRSWDPLRKITPKQAAERTGMPYGQMLALIKVHGFRMGKGYYISEARLIAVLSELEGGGAGC